MQTSKKPTVNQALGNLRVFKIEVYDKATNTWGDGQRHMASVWKTYQQGRRVAMSECLHHMSSLHTKGRTRFATPDERKTEKKLSIPRPAECYSNDDLTQFQKILSSALRQAGHTEYVYAQSAQAIAGAEFGGDKLKHLLNGHVKYPTLDKGGLWLRARSWRARSEMRRFVSKKGRDKGKSKVCETWFIETTALIKGGPRVRFELRTIRDRPSKHGEPSKNAVLSKLAAIGYDKQGRTLPKTFSEDGWAKGALSIYCKHPDGIQGRREWTLQIPFASPKTRQKANSGTIMFLHRSVVNALFILIIDKQKKKFYTHAYPGERVVALKRQMSARRSRVLRDISTMSGKSHGQKHRHRALKKLGDKEKRQTATEMWRMARWVQGYVEEIRPSLIVMDNFGKMKSDLENVTPYVRRWPYAQLKMQITDAIQRRGRLKTKIVESPAAFLSRRCPICRRSSKRNIRRLPRTQIVRYEYEFAPIPGETNTKKLKDRTPGAQDGEFKCDHSACGFFGELELVQTLNLFQTVADKKESPIPRWAVKVVNDQLDKLTKYRRRYKKETRQAKAPAKTTNIKRRRKKAA